MKKSIFYLIMAGLFVAGCNQPEKINYPQTAKVDTVDVYFGTEVEDPYRWLEDDTAAATEAWVKTQNEVTFGYLDKIEFRDDIEKRLTQIWDYPKVSAPFKEGGRYYIFRNDGLQNQDVVYVMDELNGEEELFLDPNTFSEDGTVALSTFRPSRDGKYVGYGISRGGSDWNEFFVMNAGSKEKLTDHLEWIKFSPLSWYGDGFFYSRYPEPKEGDELSGVNMNNKIYYHKIGDDQSQDQLIYEEPENPERGFGPYVTEDQNYLVIYVMESTKGNGVYYKDLTKKNSKVVKLWDNFENDFQPVHHMEGTFYVLTDIGAPKYRLIAVDIGKSAEENWKEIIPEQEDVLRNVSFVGGKIIANYMQDAHSVIKIYEPDGTYLYDLDIPIIGTVGGFRGKFDEEITFYTVTSFTTPSIVYKYDVTNNVSEEFSRSQVDFDPNLYETKQVFYESKDGTRVPMFIVHKKDVELNGENPALLYGYGGFNVSYTPYFSITRLALLEQGFVFALANIRGGGEYGEAWHEAGTLMQKQNVFDDFIAAAEYLIDNKYTNPDKLGIQGGSNGGLLVGAVINQRPDLFAVALPAVGVMDMLRYHKFTIGKYWATDYGTSEDSQEMFEYLYGYSPLHNIKAGLDYPAVLVTTADHDDRVVPAHSFKYIATLQEKYDGANPVMIRVETKAGHGGGMPTSMIIKNYADVWAFLMKNLGVEPEYQFDEE